MNFDYRFGTEATFFDWVNDGIAKAEEILSSAENVNKQDDKFDDEKNK